MPSSAHYTIPPPLGKLGAGHRVPAPNAARLVYRPSGRSQEITSGTLVPGGRPEFGSEVVVPTAMADEYGAQFIFLCASAVHRQRRRPGVVQLSSVLRDLRAYSCFACGRHPTDARQVGPNPRISAGSPVVCDWRRLFRYPRAREKQDDVKKFSTTT